MCHNEHTEGTWHVGVVEAHNIVAGPAIGGGVKQAKTIIFVLLKKIHFVVIRCHSFLGKKVSGINGRCKRGGGRERIRVRKGERDIENQYIHIFMYKKERERERGNRRE